MLKLFFKNDIKIFFKKKLKFYFYFLELICEKFKITLKIF